MTRIEQLDRDIEEAERANAASDQALRTHGHQGITWALAKHDGARLYALRQERAALSSTQRQENP